MCIRAKLGRQRRQSRAPTDGSDPAVAGGQNCGVLARNRLGEQVGVGVAELGFETVAQTLYEDAEEGPGTVVAREFGR